MLTLTYGPSAPALTLEEIKAHLRLEPDYTDEDPYLSAAYQRAYDLLVAQIGYPLLTSSYEETKGRLTSAMKLTLPNIRSVTKIDYFDEDNNPQALDPNTYDLHGQTIAVVEPPQTYAREDAVTVTYQAGADSLAGDMQQVLLMIIADIYDQRESRTDAPTVEAAPYLQRFAIHAQRRMPI